MQNPNQTPHFSFPKLDASLVEDCIEQAGGDIAKVAQLLSLSVGPLQYDDEDQLLPQTNSSEGDSSDIEKERKQETNTRILSINDKWEELKQRLNKEDLETIEEVIRLRLHKGIEATCSELFNKK
ncbi:CUE domain-containing protein [Entamoeba marina]